MITIAQVILIITVSIGCTPESRIQLKYQTESYKIPTEYTLADFDFINDSTLIAVGSYQSYFISQDSGKNWGKYAFNTIYPIAHVAAISDNEIIIANQKMYKSYNQGKNFEEIGEFLYPINSTLTLLIN